MRKAFKRHWGPKIISLILATAIWMVIRGQLIDEGTWEDPTAISEKQGQKNAAPRARIPSANEIRNLEETR